MKITYTGRTDALTPPQLRRIETKFSKLARLLDMRQGEREAHVILSAERHLHRAEITVRFHDHVLVGEGTGAETFPAIHEAIDRLARRVLKLRAKRRDTKRLPKTEKEAFAETASVPAAFLAPEEEAGEEAGPEPRVFRFNHRAGRKPMTLEEALLEMEQDRDYLVYRDAENDRLSVLIRRRDGNFDLIEA